MKIEDVWQDWHVEKKIGRGSYGTVYKCFKEADGERTYAAIKVISVPGDDIELQSSGSLDRMTAEQSKTYYKEIVDGFMREIEILESLKGHPNIVRVDDSVVVEDPDSIGWHLFIRMELLTDFNAYSCDRSFSEQDVIRMAADLGSALQACAKKNIIHRDIKPENIFVDENGTFKLGDFGVAKQLEHTQTALSRKGTPNYMAPEVLNAQMGDTRADIYSLGIVMYQLLNNNRLPFLDPNKQFITHSEREKAFKRRTQDAEKLPELPNVRPELNAVVLKATQFRKEDRFKNMDEFADALDLLAGKKKSAKIRRLGWSKKRKAALACLAVLLLLAAGCGVYAAVEPETTRQIAERVSMRMLSAQEQLEQKKEDLGETGKYEILNSGLINGIFTFNQVDYYADVTGLYRVQAGKAPQQLTEKSCSTTFSIIKDTIFFTVETAASGDTEQTKMNYDCWRMDLNGGQQKRLFSYQGRGCVVYESPEAIYYLDETTGSADQTLMRVQKDDVSNPVQIQEKVGDAAFCSSELYFHKPPPEGRSTEVYVFDVWKAEHAHHFRWETVEPVSVGKKAISAQTGSTLVSVNNEALLAFVEDEDNDTFPISLSVMDADTRQWYKIREVSAGAVCQIVDADTVALRLKKNATDQDQYYTYTFSKKNLENKKPEKGLSKPLITDVVFGACVLNDVRYAVHETNEGAYYLSRTTKENATTKENVTTYAVLPLETEPKADIGRYVLLIPGKDEAGRDVFEVRVLDQMEWTDVNPDKLFLDEAYQDVPVTYRFEDPVEGFIYQPGSAVYLRYAPSLKAERRKETIRANHAEKVLILTEELKIGNNGFRLCQNEEGQRSWVYTGSVHEGVFGEYENLKYDVVDGKKNSLCIAITGALDKRKVKGTLEIPKSILGLDVTEIGSGAFDSCQELTAVVLPTCLTEIGAHAFYNCSNLKSVDLSSVLWIDEGAFERCSALSGADLRDVRVLEPSAFKDCTSLKSVTLPDTDGYSVDDEVFAGCDSLSSVSPGPEDWVQRDWTISETAFLGCKKDFLAQYRKAKEKLEQPSTDGPELETVTETTDDTDTES